VRRDEMSRILQRGGPRSPRVQIYRNHLEIGLRSWSDPGKPFSCAWWDAFGHPDLLLRFRGSDRV